MHSLYLYMATLQTQFTRLTNWPCHKRLILKHWATYTEELWYRYSHFPPRKTLLLMAVETKENYCQPTTVVKYKEETEDISVFWHTSLSLTFTLPIALSALNPIQKTLCKLQKLHLQLHLSYPSPRSSQELVSLSLPSEALNAKMFLKYRQQIHLIEVHITKYRSGILSVTVKVENPTYIGLNTSRKSRLDLMNQRRMMLIHYF